MIFRMLVAMVISMIGVTDGPTEYFPTEPGESSGVPHAVYFPETSQYLRGEFLQFWWDNGGLNVFGYPVSGKVEQNGLTAQYFERAVLERHPENDPDWRVLVRQLGMEAAGPSNRWKGEFLPSEESEPGEYFPETQQNLAPEFQTYWERHGGVRVFGFPISAPFQSNGTTVQYFERAVLQYDPDQPRRWRILQPHLGAEAAAFDGVDTSPQPHDESIPVFDPALWPQGGTSDDTPVVYLTFDDGPHPVWTPKMLDLLEQYDAYGTFFVLGQYADWHPDLIERIAFDGHSLANHSYDHSIMAGMSWSEFKWQIRETERAVGSDMSPCYRPPYAAMDSNTKAFAAELGYDTIIWDIDTLDWQQPGAEIIADRVISQARDGAVVLLHDGGDKRAQTVDALEIILERLSEQGYQFEAMCR